MPVDAAGASGPPADRSRGAPRGSARRLIRRAAWALAVLLGALVLAGGAGALWFRSRLIASLPRLDGEIALSGLGAPVRIDRDALGVPTIRASSRADLARATGFLHAQDRLVQMDLLRRQAAGELAEILGSALLPEDRRNRVYRFRAVARRVVERTSSEGRSLLQAYAEGVNAGIAALGAKPFEYIALRADPAPWSAEDSVLVILAMFIDLHDEDGSRESAMGVMHDVLPEPLFEFLAPRGTEWDAPVEGDPFPSPPVPGPDVFDLRMVKRAASPAAAGPRPIGPPDIPSVQVEPMSVGSEWDSAAAGSNNWAVSGRYTAHGGAIVANDMHLGLMVPNTWYRASFVWGEVAGEIRAVTGVTLPGTPAMVVGSNMHVAWGFTNSYGDWTDLVIVEPDPRRAGHYLTREGSKPFERHLERIRVHGGPDETLPVVSTIWGPIIDKDHRGRPRALRWTALDVEAVDFGLLRLEAARDLEDAVEIANRSGAPPQNFVVADAEGRIGWSILGAIPRRVGYDGRLPGSWADGTRRWDGYLRPEEYPRILDPASGRLWTANARVVGGGKLETIGDGGYDLGARARQIRDGIMALPKASERDMLAVQLDDRAIFLTRWRDLLLRTLTPEAVSSDPRRRELKEFVEAWGGRASVDSVGFRAVRAWRQFLAEQVFGALTASCKAADARFNYGEIAQTEGPLWRLVSERPPHLLDPKRAGWDDQLLAAVDATLDYFLGDGSALAERTWGQRNTARIRHPLSLAVPFLGRWLDMPEQQLPGADDMPRVQGPTYGASQRMVVSPGREAEGIFHMPCGQSGHPLSSHYGDAHMAWARGDATPFLPGPPVHTLSLNPGR